jgi:hypothetical protein
MPTPSFILPSAPVYEEGTLYGLELYGSNFVPSPMSFTRATTATRVNADGLVELVPYNLLQRSEEFDNGLWSKTGITVTPNQGIAPDGTLTMDLITFDSAARATTQVANVTSGETYTFSVWLATQSGTQTVDIGNINVSTFQSVTVTTTPQRFEVTQVASAATRYPGIKSTAAYSILAWGAQLVEGTEALPYLKTETRLNRPRVDFSLPGCPNLLLEPQRTNLVFYSEDFSNAYWTKQAGITATYNTTETLSPDGTYNATKFVGNGTTGVLKTSISVSGVVSRSVYLKSVTGTTTATFKEPNTNVPSPITLTITNEWQRFEMIGDNGSSLQGLQIDDITSDGIYMWGAQLEVGAYPTTYIPTTTASVTRNADSFIQSNVFSRGMITAAGGTWFVELRNNISRTRDLASRIGIGDTSNLGANNISLGSASNGRATMQKFIAGIPTGLFTTTTDTCKLAIKWNGATADIFQNGVKVVSATAFTTTNMEFLNSNTLGVPFFINQMSLYPTPLSDDQLEALTGEGFNTYAEMANYYNYITQ